MIEEIQSFRQFIHCMLILYIYIYKMYLYWINHVEFEYELGGYIYSIVGPNLFLLYHNLTQIHRLA